MGKVYQPKTTIEAIESLESFLCSDIWYCIEEEFKCEFDVVKYLEAHFKILKKQVKKINQKNNEKKD